MECDRRWHIIYMIFSAVLSSLFPKVVGSSEIYDPLSLDALIRDNAFEAIARQRMTGSWSNVSLPANFSGIEASVVRLRSGSLWFSGISFGSLFIPPGVAPFPFTKRMIMVYYNLRNWSHLYYEVPGYDLVAPVVSFSYYNASDLRAFSNERLRVSAMGDPLFVRFPRVVTKDEHSLKCVKLGPGGWFQFRNMTKNNVCMTRGDGHFAIVAPSPNIKRRRNMWKWWVAGIAGLLALVLLSVILYTIYMLVWGVIVRKLKAESENGVALETTWVKTSRMPSASTIRTQPTIEQDYAP